MSYLPWIKKNIMRNNYLKPLMKDMEPIYSPGLDCLENSVLTITNWEFGEYHKAFMHSWGFAYNRENSPIIGKRIMANNHEIYNDIRARYGVLVTQYMEKDIEKIREKIDDELKHNRPVIVSADEYHCHWTTSYNKHHYIHFYIIVGQTENKDFYCIDTHPKKRDILVTNQQFMDSCNLIYTYDIQAVRLDNRYLHEIIYDSIINDHIYRLQLNDMELFIDDFKNIDFEAELMHESIWYSPIYSEINRIFGGRAQYIEFLKDYEINEYIREYMNQLNKITYEWNIIRSLILKLSNDKDDSTVTHQSIMKRLKSVSQLEKNLMNLLIRQLESNQLHPNNYIAPAATKEVNTEKAEFYYVNMEPHLNDKGLYFDKDSFQFTNNILTGTIWDIADMSFDFTNRDQLDNMTCVAQTIPINKNSYSRLMFLGYGTWGDQIEDLRIVYEDGSYDTIEIMFSDWWKDPELHETIAWQSDGISLIDGNAYNGKIFARSYPLPNKKKNIIQLIFPSCDKIHIFAITLA